MVARVEKRLSGRPSGVDHRTRTGNPKEPAPFYGDAWGEPLGGGSKCALDSALTREESQRRHVGGAGEEEWTRQVLLDALSVCSPEWERYLDGGEQPSWWRKKKHHKAPLLRSILPPGCLSLEEALSRLERVRPNGDEWRAFCPVHETHHRTLVISRSEMFPGEGWFYCYVGCTHSQIREKLLQMRPLLGGDGNREPNAPRAFGDTE